MTAAVDISASDDSVPGQWVGFDTVLHCTYGYPTDWGCIDCFTAGSCTGNGAQYYTCPPETPFCNGQGVCTSQRDLTWDMCDEQILDQQLSCSSEGFFPDPLDCRRYLLCPDPIHIPNQQCTRYRCPNGYVYDSFNYNCKKQRLAEDCVTIKCTSGNTFVSYPANENYYGFCKAPGTPQLFKCASGHYFNLKKSVCQYRCTKAGYFAVTSNKVPRNIHCATGYLWSESDLKCIKDNMSQCTITRSTTLF